MHPADDLLGFSPTAVGCGVEEHVVPTPTAVHIVSVVLYISYKSSLSRLYKVTYTQSQPSKAPRDPVPKLCVRYKYAYVS